VPPFLRPWKLRTFSQWKIPISMQSRKFNILLSMIIIIIINYSKTCKYLRELLLEVCQLQRFCPVIPLSEGLIPKVKWPNVSEQQEHQIKKNKKIKKIKIAGSTVTVVRNTNAWWAVHISDCWKFI